MVNIKKRDGRTEAFDASKLERSLRSTGASANTVREVTSRVKAREGMTVDEIRTTVSKELRARDAKAAEHYDGTRRMVATTAVEAATGTVRMTEEMMRSLRVSAGDSVELSYSGRTRSLRAERASPGVRGVQLSTTELRALGVRDGSRVTVSRRA